MPWLTGLSTFVGVTAAVFAGYYAARAFKREVARDEQRERDVRAAQASLVAGWGDHMSGLISLEVEEWNYYLSNRSALPVYDVTFGLVDDKGERWTYLTRLNTLAPTDEPTARPFGSPHLRALISDELKRLGQDQRNLPESEQFRLDNLGVGVQFRDSAGRVWHRTSRGVLAEGEAPWGNSSHEFRSEESVESSNK